MTVHLRPPPALSAASLEAPPPLQLSVHLATLPLSQLDLLTAQLSWLRTCANSVLVPLSVCCAFLQVTSSGCTTKVGKERLLERLSLAVWLQH